MGELELGTVLYESSKTPHTLYGVRVCDLFPEFSSSLSMRGGETDLDGFGPFCRTEHTAFRMDYSMELWM